MKSFKGLLLFSIVFISFVSCNTLYNSRFIDIEIIEPGKLIIPKKYSTAVIKYNNSNINFNPYYANYFVDSLTYTDSTNIDSLASKIYFTSVVQHLQNQVYFDSIAEIPPRNFSQNFIANDKLESRKEQTDSLISKDSTNENPAVKTLSFLVENFQEENSHKTDTVFIDPEFGLYSRQDLENIADSTGADLLISFDYFSSFDGKYRQKIDYQNYYGISSVSSMGIWNFYNLKKIELEFFYNHFDTLNWEVRSIYFRELDNVLPSRRDAILNAADISGERFVNDFFPHWIKIERLYYKSGQYEFKETEKYIEEGNWLKAAEIWKSNLDNPNKKIVAKSMFNLAVACEMEGKLDAAIDWAVKSFYIFENRNLVHSKNCKEYLKILAQRKQDVRMIELQINPEITNE